MTTTTEPIPARLRALATELREALDGSYVHEKTVFRISQELCLLNGDWQTRLSWNLFKGLELADEKPHVLKCYIDGAVAELERMAERLEREGTRDVAV